MERKRGQKKRKLTTPDRSNRRPSRFLHRAYQSYTQPKPKPPPFNTPNRPRSHPVSHPQSSPPAPGKTQQIQHALPGPARFAQQKPASVTVYAKYSILPIDPRRLRTRHRVRVGFLSALGTRIDFCPCASDAFGGALWRVVHGCFSAAIAQVDG